jgi:PAS domain S-box-containing protein
MMAPVDRDYIARLRFLSKASSVLAILVGILVLIGWEFDIALLKSILPIWVAMKFNTALAFVLSGVSLWLLQEPSADAASDSRPQIRHRRLAAQACAVAVALISALTLVQYVFGWDLGIDQLFIREPFGAVETSHPGRMAPTTALNFLLLGGAFLFLSMKSRQVHRVGQLLALGPASISFLTLAGYGYGVQSLYQASPFTPMAVHTAVVFFMLAIGVIAACPDTGLAAVFASTGLGGVIVRRLLPSAIAVLLGLGWLRLAGQHIGLYGTEFGVALSTVASILVLGGLVWWVARSLDVVDAERQRAQEERDRLFNLSLDMFCVAGFDGYFKQLNPAWERTLGYPIKELLAQPYLSFIHPDDQEATVAEAQKLTTGTVTIAFENRYRCRDGSYKWFLWNATPALDQQLIYAVAHDITERKEAEEKIKKLNQDLQHRTVELEATNKELEAFSYSVSHDLRAPLRHIDGFVGLFQKHVGDKLDEKGRRYLTTISTAAKQMGTLIDDLLVFSRMGRAEVHQTRVHLGSLVKEVQRSLSAETKGRTIEWKVDALPDVQADPAMLRQVLVNLLANAVKYTRPRERAEIEIGCVANDSEVVVLVRDNGVGFDMEYVHKLFGVFQRLHSASEFEGTGIGLANVRRIIHRHGGRTWAEGTVGGGATFYFSLPVGSGDYSRAEETTQVVTTNGPGS